MESLQSGEDKMEPEQTITLQVGVKALLKNKEGKYLMLYRSVEKYPDVNDRWDIPGGRIQPGNTLMKNLDREIQEETGLRLTKPPTIVAAQDILIPNSADCKKHVVRITYVGEVEGEVKLDGAEHTKYAWFSAEELKQLNEIDKYLKEILPSIM